MRAHVTKKAKHSRSVGTSHERKFLRVIGDRHWRSSFIIRRVPSTTLCVPLDNTSNDTYSRNATKTIVLQMTVRTSAVFIEQTYQLDVCFAPNATIDGLPPIAVVTTRRALRRAASVY